jgi:hypothetical protein
MSANHTGSNMVCVLGVAGVQGAVELYAVNAAREVTMHGWFVQNTGFSVLSDRPNCLIAVDAGVLPDEMIAVLRDRGHSVVVMPSTGLPSQSNYRRTARDVCQLAMGLAGSYSGSAPRQLQ